MTRKNKMEISRRFQFTFSEEARLALKFSLENTIDLLNKDQNKSEESEKTLITCLEIHDVISYIK